MNRRYRCLDADYSQQQEIEQPAGACLAVTRSVWESVGGMDPAFFPVWFEDVDFCARLLESGAKIVYCPAARFQHSWSPQRGATGVRRQADVLVREHGALCAKALCNVEGVHAPRRDRDGHGTSHAGRMRGGKPAGNTVGNGRRRLLARGDVGDRSERSVPAGSTEEA